MDSKKIYDTKFSTGLRGYNTAQVDAFMDEVAIALDKLNGQIEELTAKNTALSAQNEAYAKDAERVGTLETNLRDTMITAQTTSARLVTESKQRAQDILDQANTQAEQIVADAQNRAETIVRDAQASLGDILTRTEAAKESMAQYKEKIQALMSAQLDVLDNYFGTEE